MGVAKGREVSLGRDDCVMVRGAGPALAGIRRGTHDAQAMLPLGCNGHKHGETKLASPAGSG